MKNRSKTTRMDKTQNVAQIIFQHRLNVPHSFGYSSIHPNDRPRKAHYICFRSTAFIPLVLQPQFVLNQVEYDIKNQASVWSEWWGYIVTSVEVSTATVCDALHTRYLEWALIPGSFYKDQIDPACMTVLKNNKKKWDYYQFKTFQLYLEWIRLQNGVVVSAQGIHLP